jgi:hypothetical protein
MLAQDLGVALCVANDIAVSTRIYKFDKENI